MMNILDYVRWRADVPLSIAPFNEVDNLIFSEMVFADFGGIVSSDECELLPLGQAVERYFEKFPGEGHRLGLIVPSEVRTLLRLMGESKRYGSLLLSGYEENTDESVQKQFAALSIHLDDLHIYVAFRGTDDTLVGWKENFNMSFLKAIPAQLASVGYLERVARSFPKASLIVGGHSKGGNLAIYAAVYCERSVKDRIVRVYSNDGPGYRPEVIQSEEYREIRDRISKIVPQSSVVGRLLEHDERYKVVNSMASGLWQHDGFSWEVGPYAFVPAPSLSKESRVIDRSLRKWISEMSPEQRQEISDALYRILTATNAKTLTELTQDKYWLWRLISESDPGSRKTVIAALAQLTGEAGRVLVEDSLPSASKEKEAETARKARTSLTPSKLASEVSKRISTRSARTKQKK